MSRRAARAARFPYTTLFRSGLTITGASSSVSDYYQLTTLQPQLDYAFTQYGRYEITMSGWVEDVYGNRYDGGGTYEVIAADRKSTRLNSSHVYTSYAVVRLNEPAGRQGCPLSLHDALPIWADHHRRVVERLRLLPAHDAAAAAGLRVHAVRPLRDHDERLGRRRVRESIRRRRDVRGDRRRSEEHTSELQSRLHLVCRRSLE